MHLLSIIVLVLVLMLIWWWHRIYCYDDTIVYSDMLYCPQCYQYSRCSRCLQCLQCSQCLCSRSCPYERCRYNPKKMRAYDLPKYKLFPSDVYQGQPGIDVGPYLPDGVVDGTIPERWRMYAPDSEDYFSLNYTPGDYYGPYGPVLAMGGLKSIGMPDHNILTS